MVQVFQQLLAAMFPSIMSSHPDCCDDQYKGANHNADPRRAHFCLLRHTGFETLTGHLPCKNGFVAMPDMRAASSQAWRAWLPAS
jgi:hypothetical protein